MPISAERLKRFVLSPTDAEEVDTVDVFGRDFVAHLRSIDAEINKAHVHGAKSAVIQDLMTKWLMDRDGVRTEVIDKFSTTRTRPDFVADLGADIGVLIEVERGGAVTNNHDLKDVWKCHLWPTTRHLFLLVPHSNWRKDGQVRERPFTRSVKRLRTFFDDERRFIDVLSAWVIGYGLTEPIDPTLASQTVEADDSEAST